MKPFLHSRGSVKRWGGKPSDYDAIHDFIDGSKIAMPDLRHRAALHHAFGCFLVERVFGRTIMNSDGREVSTRDVAEQHVIEDLGFLPSLEDFLDELPLSKWHGGIHRLPKDEHAEEQAKLDARRPDARRARVRAVFARMFGDAVPDPDDVELDTLIAAALGSDEHQT